MAGKGRGVRIKPGVASAKVSLRMPEDLLQRVDKLASGNRNDWILGACEKQAIRDETNSPT